MRRTREFLHAYRGYHPPGAVCRIAVYEEPRPAGAVGRPPIVLATELPENRNTSITNMAECPAAEVIARCFPDWPAWLAALPPDTPPLVWIEHYPADRVLPDRYRLVTFSHYRPAPTERHTGGRGRRLTLGTPRWQPVAPVTVGRLLGHPFSAEPARRGR